MVYSHEYVHDVFSLFTKLKFGDTPKDGWGEGVLTPRNSLGPPLLIHHNLDKAIAVISKHS